MSKLSRTNLTQKSILSLSKIGLGLGLGLGLTLLMSLSGCDQNNRPNDPVEAAKQSKQVFEDYRQAFAQWDKTMDGVDLVFLNRDQILEQEKAEWTAYLEEALNRGLPEAKNEVCLPKNGGLFLENRDQIRDHLCDSITVEEVEGWIEKIKKDAENQATSPAINKKEMIALIKKHGGALSGSQPNEWRDRMGLSIT